MALENKLGITNSAELAREEERISKKKAVELFESGALDKLVPGRFASLQAIHKALFEDIYDFAGEIRTVNMAKGNFRFAPLMYLQAALENFSSPKFKARIIGDRLVVFQNNANDNVIKTVESVYKGQSLKISLSPDYVRQITNLSPTGQMRVIVLNPQESSIIIKDFTQKYFGVKSDLFTKLLGVKDTAFVVNK